MDRPELRRFSPTGLTQQTAGGRDRERSVNPPNSYSTCKRLLPPTNHERDRRESFAF